MEKECCFSEVFSPRAREGDESVFYVDRREGTYKYYITLPIETGSTNGDILMRRFADVIHEASSLVSYLYLTKFPRLGDAVKEVSFDKLDESIEALVKIANFLADELRNGDCKEDFE